jgi:hypothetical protein
MIGYLSNRHDGRLSALSISSMPSTKHLRLVLSAGAGLVTFYVITSLISGVKNVVLALCLCGEPKNSQPLSASKLQPSTGYCRLLQPATAFSPPGGGARNHDQNHECLFTLIFVSAPNQGKSKVSGEKKESIFSADPLQSPPGGKGSCQALPSLSNAIQTFPTLFPEKKDCLFFMATPNQPITNLPIPRLTPRPINPNFLAIGEPHHLAVALRVRRESADDPLT